MFAKKWAVALFQVCVVAASLVPLSAKAGHYPMYASWPQPDGVGSPITLTYSFSNLLDGGIVDRRLSPLPSSDLRAAFEQAFADYAAILPIHFVEVADGAGPAPETGPYDPTGLADIRIGVVPNVDGANAYAYFPRETTTNGLAGDIVFNGQRFGFGWSLTLFYAVAQHELGHSLGMGHYVDDTDVASMVSGNADPVISSYPFDEGTISALQAVYGAGVGSVRPLSAVPEPDAWGLLVAGLLALAWDARRSPRSVKRARERVGQVGRAASLAMGLVVLAPSAQAITIEFDYTYDTRGFFTDQATGAAITERRAVLEQAASFYSGFTDSLSAIDPGVGDSWAVRITHPSLGGAPVTLSNLSIAADTLRIYVGGSTSAPGVLGFAGTGTVVSLSGSDAFTDAVLTRGQANATGANATDYGTWGGYIWFNAANDWYFGADGSGLSAGHPDFLTTAVHEIGHILGFGEADSWLAQIDSAGRFTGANSVAVHGGPVPVDRFGSHWGEGVGSQVGGVPQETLMDPSTTVGQREYLTALDYAGFADIGWQVSAVPEPHSAWLVVPGALLALSAASRRKRKSDAREGRHVVSTSVIL